MSVRALSDADLPRLTALIASDPVKHLFLASRIKAFGLDPVQLGSVVLGYFEDDELLSACHVGANVVPIAASGNAISEFARAIGRRGRAASIMGEAGPVLALHQALISRWGGEWSMARKVRAHQPLLVIDDEPKIVGDERVDFITARDFEPYLRAAVAMYTEELGVTPLGRGSSYPAYIRSLIAARRATGAVFADRVWFKTDIGAAAGNYCQIQGVWLDPGLRGQGLSEAAVAQAVRLARLTFPVVSLYVNDFNTPARALYDRIGFQQVGEFATVLF